MILVLTGTWILIDEYTTVDKSRASEYLMAVEAGSNILVMATVLAVFLIGLERLLKRRQALAAINDLRAIAHVIDMHQLTKDPAIDATAYTPTVSSPQRVMSPGDLIRYLNYCSEMLALVGKLAAIYIQKFDDAVTLEAANDIENLTTQLSRKIWQKIMIANAKLAKTP